MTEFIEKRMRRKNRKLRWSGQILLYRRILFEMGFRFV